MILNNTIFCDNATEAFVYAYRTVHEHGEVVESRIGKTKHLTDITIIMNNPYNNICLDPIRNMSLKYTLGEIQWYISGSNKVADIAKYAKMWNDLTDDGETVNSAYGYRIFHKFGFNQLQYCIDKLRKNPYDRQCVIHIKEASNTPTKDTPCTCLLQFTCMDGKLNLHTYMRSNDIWFGLPYDIAFFTVILQIVCEFTGLAAGKYYHTVGDLHIYEKHWNKSITEHKDLMVEEGWDYTQETEESINKMINGEKPDNLLLRNLWRINNVNKKR